MKYETFIARFNDGTEKSICCKKCELKDYLTIREFEKLVDIHILNRANDKTKHKPFTLELER